jgi:hypothetical protein
MANVLNISNIISAQLDSETVSKVSPQGFDELDFC